MFSTRVETADGYEAHAHAEQLNLIWTFALAGQIDPSGVALNAKNPGAA